MTGADFFMFMYPIVPLVGITGYLPQIINLFRTTEAPKSISLSTWMIWTITWIVSFGYAIFSLQDLLFATTSGMNLVGHVLIIALAIYKRHKYDRNKKPLLTIFAKI
jgi:hypothetical protein